VTDAKFWRVLGNQFKELETDGSIRFQRSEDGQPQLIGNPETIDRFKALAARGARRLGFVGTDEEAMLYWVNRLLGEQARKTHFDGRRVIS